MRKPVKKVAGEGVRGEGRTFIPPTHRKQIVVEKKMSARGRIDGKKQELKKAGRKCVDRHGRDQWDSQQMSGEKLARNMGSAKSAENRAR